MSGEILVTDVRASRTVNATWVWQLGALAALLAFILVMFRYEAALAVEVWWVYPTYSHCFLIIPISAWLIWGMRDEFLAANPELAPKALLAVVPILLVWLAAKFATINEVRQFAVVALMQVAIFAMLGERIYRRILFPALFLFFLVPVGQYLVAPMQAFAARFTDIGLNLLGVPHYTEGTLIEVSNGRFEIAEACAGLRFLIATMTLGVLFAYLTYRKWWKIALFLVSCVVVPLIGNGLRCIGIIMLAHLTNNTLAVGADHLVYGWFFNMLILVVLYLIGLHFRDPIPEPQSLVGSGARRASRGAVLALVAGTAAAIFCGPALAYWREVQPIVVNQEALNRPLAVAGWDSVPPSANWSPIFVQPDAHLASGLSVASSGAPQVDLVVEFYGRMREGHSLIATTNKLWNEKTWHQVESHAVTVPLGGTPVRFQEAIIASPVDKRLVWSTYWMDGTFTNSALAIKLRQIKTALSGADGAAMIALSTPIEGAPELARARLTAAAQALGELPNRLTDAGRAPPASRAAN